MTNEDVDLQRTIFIKVDDGTIAEISLQIALEMIEISTKLPCENTIANNEESSILLALLAVTTQRNNSEMNSTVTLLDNNTFTRISDLCNISTLNQSVSNHDQFSLLSNIDTPAKLYNLCCVSLKELSKLLQSTQQLMPFHCCEAITKFHHLNIRDKQLTTIFRSLIEIFPNNFCNVVYFYLELRFNSTESDTQVDLELTKLLIEKSYFTILHNLLTRKQWDKFHFNLYKLCHKKMPNEACNKMIIRKIITGYFRKELSTIVSDLYKRLIVSITFVEFSQILPLELFELLRENCIPIFEYNLENYFLPITIKNYRKFYKKLLDLIPLYRERHIITVIQLGIKSNVISVNNNINVLVNLAKSNNPFVIEKVLTIITGYRRKFEFIKPRFKIFKAVLENFNPNQFVDINIGKYLHNFFVDLIETFHLIAAFVDFNEMLHLKGIIKWFLYYCFNELTQTHYNYEKKLFYYKLYQLIGNFVKTDKFELDLVLKEVLSDQITDAFIENISHIDNDLDSNKQVAHAKFCSLINNSTNCNFKNMSECLALLNVFVTDLNRNYIIKYLEEIMQDLIENLKKQSNIESNFRKNEKTGLYLILSCYNELIKQGNLLKDVEILEKFNKFKELLVEVVVPVRLENFKEVIELFELDNKQLEQTAIEILKLLYTLTTSEMNTFLPLFSSFVKICEEIMEFSTWKRLVMVAVKCHQDILVFPTKYRHILELPSKYQEVPSEYQHVKELHTKYQEEMNRFLRIYAMNKINDIYKRNINIPTNIRRHPYISLVISNVLSALIIHKNENMITNMHEMLSTKIVQTSTTNVCYVISLEALTMFYVNTHVKLSHLTNVELVLIATVKNIGLNDNWQIITALLQLYQALLLRITDNIHLNQNYPNFIPYLLSILETSDLDISKAIAIHTVLTIHNVIFPLHTIKLKIIKALQAISLLNNGILVKLAMEAIVLLLPEDGIETLLNNIQLIVLNSNEHKSKSPIVFSRISYYLYFLQQIISNRETKLLSTKYDYGTFINSYIKKSHKTTVNSNRIFAISSSESVYEILQNHKQNLDCLPFNNTLLLQQLINDTLRKRKIYFVVQSLPFIKHPSFDNKLVIELVLYLLLVGIQVEHLVEIKQMFKLKESDGFHMAIGLLNGENLSEFTGNIDEKIAIINALKDQMKRLQYRSYKCFYSLDYDLLEHVKLYLNKQ